MFVKGAGSCLAVRPPRACGSTKSPAWKPLALGGRRHSSGVRADGGEGNAPAFSRSWLPWRVLCDAAQPGTRPVPSQPDGSCSAHSAAQHRGVGRAVRKDHVTTVRMLCLHSEEVEIFLKENSCYLSAYNIRVDMLNMEVVWPFGERAEFILSERQVSLAERGLRKRWVGWSGVGWADLGPAPLPTQGVLLFQRREFCICNINKWVTVRLGSSFLFARHHF